LVVYYGLEFITGIEMRFKLLIVHDKCLC